MTKESVLRLRYLGMLPQIGYREYGFRIENNEKEIRQVIVTIDDAYFLKNQLMLQEAPDLCYQRMLRQIEGESAEGLASGASTIPITPIDIAHYRESHKTGKAREHRS